MKKSPRDGWPADIQERIYRGKFYTPQTHKSIRVVALSASVREDLESWLAESPRGQDAWVFPSEKLNTPLSKDNALYRYIRPRLKTVGLESRRYGFSKILRSVRCILGAAFTTASGLLKTGNTQRAIGRLRNALRIAPDFYDAQFQLGLHYMMSDQQVQAEEVLARAAELNPRVADLSSSSGSCIYT